MALSELYLLADFGLGGVPATRLRDLAERTDALGRETGDARLCTVAKALLAIEGLWPEAEDVVPTEWVQRIDALIEGRLGGVLGAEGEEGQRLAQAFLHDVQALTADLRR